MRERHGLDPYPILAYIPADVTTIDLGNHVHFFLIDRELKRRRKLALVIDALYPGNLFEPCGDFVFIEAKKRSPVLDSGKRADVVCAYMLGRKD